MRVSACSRPARVRGVPRHSRTARGCWSPTANSVDGVHDHAARTRTPRTKSSDDHRGGSCSQRCGLDGVRLQPLALEQAPRHRLARSRLVPLPLGDARRGAVLDPAAQQVGADRRRHDHRRPDRAADLLEQRPAARRRSRAAVPGNRLFDRLVTKSVRSRDQRRQRRASPARGTRRRRLRSTVRRYFVRDRGNLPAPAVGHDRGRRVLQPRHAVEHARAASRGRRLRARRAAALRRPSRTPRSFRCSCCASARIPE